MAPISPPPLLGKVKKPNPKNHRATVRYHCPPATLGRVYGADDVEFHRAWLQDLSATGVGLLLGKPLETNLPVTIQIKSPNSKKHYALTAYAIHSTEQADGNWLVGFQFVEPLSLEDRDDLL